MEKLPRQDPHGGPRRSEPGRAPGLWDGVAAPWRGLALMRANPSLWRGIGVALAVQVLLAIALVVAWGWVVVHWLHPQAAQTAWLGAAWRWLATVLLVVLGMGISAATGIVLGMVLNPVAFTALAERVERVRGTDLSRFTPVPVWRQVGEGLASAAEFLAVNGLCLVAGWIPGLTLPVTVVSFVYNAWFLGVSFLEYAQILRGHTRSVRRARARRYRLATLGLGAGAVFWTAIPLVGVLLSTVAVAGGVALAERMEG